MSYTSFEGYFCQGQSNHPLLNSSSGTNGSILAGTPTFQFDADEDLRWTQSSLQAHPKSSTTNPHNQTHHSSRGAFSAITGMSPSLGVPPMDAFFWMEAPTHPSTSTPISSEGGSPTNGPSRIRKRHFSLEEYQDMDDSSNSNDSGIFSRNSNMILEENPRALGSLSDLNVFKSFMNDMSYGEDALSMDFDKSMDDEHLKDLERRILQVIEEAREANKFGLEFPPGLLDIVTGHILQEAAGEPYGLKGCVLKIQYEGQTALHRVATLVCDPNTLSTFELTLTFRQAQASWGKRMARRLSFSLSIADYPVSTSYKLVKKRSYRQGEIELVS